RERDRFARGNLAFNAPRARLVNGVIVKVGVTARLAGGVEIEQGRTHALKGRQLEGHGERISQRRKLPAIGAPTQDGLVRVEVASDAQPQVAGGIGRSQGGRTARSSSPATAPAAA